MPYCVAAAWLNGAVCLNDFSDSAILRQPLRQLMGRIEHIPDPTLTPRPGYSGYPAVVQVHIGDRIEEMRIDCPLGYPERPLTAEQRLDKFVACTTDTFSIDSAKSVFHALSGQDVFKAANRLLLGKPKLS